MISQVALLGVLLYGQSAEARELPPMTKSDLEWVGRYRAVPSGDELSPSDHMQLWLFETGRFYWFGIMGIGEWRRVGDKLILLPHRFVNGQFHNYGFWKESLKMFHNKDWPNADEDSFHIYELKRDGTGFKAERWPFNTFAESWKSEPIDMTEIAKVCAELYRESEPLADEDEKSDRDEELAYERMSQYWEIAWEFSPAHQDQLAEVIVQAKDEDVVPIIMTLSTLQHSAKLQEALVKRAQDESVDLQTRRLSGYFAMKGAKRSTIDALLPLRSVERLEKLLGRQALEQAAELEYDGYLDLAREYFDPEYDGLGFEAAMRYIARFGEDRDIEVAAKLAEGTSSDSHWAKGVILAKRPESAEAKRYMDQLAVQVKHLESREDWSADLSAAAKMLFAYGRVEHVSVMEHYIEEDAPGRLSELIKMYERLDDPVVLDYLRKNIDEWNVRDGKQAQKLIDRFEGRK